jgi:two-component system, OmpR family, response regulator ChvI
LKARKRILIVDDEPDNSRIFKIALEDDGFEVDAFNDSTAALSAFKPNYYDALIFDIRMPTMTGYELYEKVKNLDNKVKVCFLTAYSEHYTEEFKTRFSSSSSSSSLSNIYFMRKPITLDDLVKKVNEIITNADNQ